MSNFDHVKIFHRDGVTSETVPADQARNKTYFNPEWSLKAWPPANWEITIPRYLVTRDLRPSPNPRHRHENPFTSIFDSDIYQFCEKPLAAGSEITTTQWPHASFRPTGNAAERYAAEQILSFFKGAMKSRLGRSPFRGGRIELTDGISGQLWAPKTPQIPPFNSRPAA